VELIDRGLVLVRGAVADTPARMVAEADPIVVDSTVRGFVSRGGNKLDAALERFAIAVHGKRCLDAGASTGGFTDCLLRRGAAQVVAVDVARGMLHSSLRDDPRVRTLERTNLRYLSLAGTGNVRFDLVVADLSFISLTTVAEVLVRELPAPQADLVLLVKPQFEVGKVVASRGRGVVKDPAERREALERVACALVSSGASIMGAMASPLLGPAGNAEYFLHARVLVGAAPGDHAVASGVLDAAIAGSPDMGRTGSSSSVASSPSRSESHAGEAGETLREDG
jgi:23S rRNA (cytidine1920-2'-O)/16S rRNA (cytidine1409-2'-O)-methyltransferase